MIQRAGALLAYLPSVARPHFAQRGPVALLILRTGREGRATPVELALEKVGAEPERGRAALRICLFCGFAFRAAV